MTWRPDAETSQDQPPVAAWPHPAYAWYVVGVLLLAYTLSFIDRMILSLLIGPIRTALDISDTEVSLLAGLAFALFYTLLGLPLGWIADRYNRRNLIVGGVTVWCAMTACCGFANSYTTLFLARVGVGAGEATLSPAAFSMLSDYFPREKLARAIAVYSIGVPLGSGIALILGAFVVQAVLQSPPVELPWLGTVEAWRLIFLWVAAPGILILVLMMTIREPVRRGRATAQEDIAQRSLLLFLSAHRFAIAAHLFGMGLISMVMYGTMAWIPTFFFRTYGMPVPEAGLYFGIITAIGGAGGLLTGGWLSDRMLKAGRKDAPLRTMLLSCLLGGPLIAAAMVMPSPWLALLMLAFGLYAATWHGIAGAALQLITPNELRAQITAVYFFVANLIGLGLGPTAIAMSTDFIFADDGALRWSIALVAIIGMTLAALILWLGLRPYARSMTAAEAGWPADARL
jgi:MFS family permease